MCFSKFLSLILSLIISNTHSFVLDNKPVIAVTQGVIERENVLPISIFWYHPNITKGDRLLVYSSNSRMFYTENITIDSYTGSYEVPHAVLERGETADKYCVVILSEHRTLDSNPSCESRVQWMYDRRDILRDFSLMDLVIPGTHNSAAYLLPNTKPTGDHKLFADWIFCQTRSIMSQLMDGIRYLDLRPGFMYEDGKKKYVVTHNVFNLISMDEVVEQINEFMEVSKDIVIVSFREFFKGFVSNEDHLDFINYLENSFQKHAQAAGHWMYSLDIFWITNRRLLLTYDHPMAKKSVAMWDPIIQYWADAQTINRLHSYLNTKHRNSWLIIEPYVAMVQLTPSFTTITEHLLIGGMSLRLWAERIGRSIPIWYTEEWNKTANIIAVDFYQTSGIVDLAIQLNEKRSLQARLNRTALLQKFLESDRIL